MARKLVFVMEKEDEVRQVNPECSPKTQTGYDHGRRGRPPPFIGSGNKNSRAEAHRAQEANPDGCNNEKTL
ncbi:uncharacterized protein ACLA_004250 [Aspergillus clavatus NRRL 1]|uniref:Uncharacterized protein n=1 Tax=Aspergillus clavatus (strain ATCC 1007 / CBS 513.65 / DSM 816 / NCTC 3887 / NRRL 1 / QM 1276 / 107) TaxID=344612 RepID=A1C5P3_ASPCL|nr:uncharacterized protein ACLA_004250 [Aspergillus clavatus NRRL 1]EAW15011.1 hypothetical protein ACLA_004250 [Aspergillus clavatus NRRL 1]